VRATAPWDDGGRLIAPHPAVSAPTAPSMDGFAGDAVLSKAERTVPAFVARHRKKFADTRVDNTDPNFLAHHRKKFAGAAGDDMGEC